MLPTDAPSRDGLLVKSPAKMDGRDDMADDQRALNAHLSAMARAAVIVASAMALALGLLAVVWLLARPLALLFAAVVIASALAPAAEWMERRSPRPLAILATYAAVVLVFGVVLWRVVPPLGAQAGQIAANMPELAGEAETLV